MILLKDVLKGIKPTKEEEREVKEKIKVVLDRINKGLKDAKAELGGSGAKGTWLAGAHDVDIFVGFDYRKYKGKSDELSDILYKHLKKKFKKISRLHGSRDYFEVKQKEFSFEVIPILKINKAEQAMNITDVSLLHAKWVKRYKKFADEIRLTKQFCRAQGVYGAESYIKGFSGYVCEILTIHYKGFLKLVKAASKWKERTIIDIMKYHRNVMHELNKSKLLSPLIIVDPVQKDRNAAAVLSKENYEKFILACRKFLKKPGKDFFIKKEMTIDKLKKKTIGKKLILLDVNAFSGKRDIVGSKLLKGFEFLKKEIDKKEFNVYESGWKWDKEKKALFWFILDPKKLSEFIVWQGPPVNLREHADKFKKKYKKTFVKKGRLFAKVKRKYKNSDKLIKDLIKDKYLKDKIKKILTAV